MTTLAAETSESEVDVYQGVKPKDIYRAHLAPIEQVAPQTQQSAILVQTTTI